MITRLHVRGFKNLTDLDVRLGAFNCIAGPNGAGKSNLFDVVALLSRLAAGATLDVAADAVRGGRRQDVAHLFTQGTSSDRRLELVVEMIVPREGVDFLLKQVRASNTFLRYRLVLVPGEGPGGLGSTLRIAEEELVPILKGAWSREICFPHEPSWRDSLLESTREGKYIRTEALGDGGRVIKMFGDSDVGRGRGRPTLASAAALPETMLSKAQDGAAHPTAVLVRREMMSWTQLALEPTALRRPDELRGPTAIDERGHHVARTLYALHQRDPNVYARVSNRLFELVDDLRTLRVDLDEKRELFTILATNRAGVELPAGALSDGMLRFLALAVLLEDPSHRGVICLEEPENGVHPKRIPAILRLLQEIAVDPSVPAGDDNPPRQVILNTHSPVVVANVDRDDLLIARVGGTGMSLLPLRRLDGFRRLEDDLARAVPTR